MKTIRGLAHRPLDLHVTRVADQRDLVALAGETLRLHVDLGHERAGGVDGAQAASHRRLAHRGRDAVRAEDQERFGRHFVGVLDEDRTLRTQVVDDVPVVHDLVAHVDGRTKALQDQFDDRDGAVDPGAEATRAREMDLHARKVARAPGPGRVTLRVSSAPKARIRESVGGRWNMDDLEAFRGEVRTWLQKNAPRSVFGRASP